MKLTTDDVSRFLSKVSRGAGCWLWAARVNRHGRGQFHLDGREENAPRVAYQIATDRDPASLSVLHTCDNPRCVRPEHLFVGTQADNMADRSRKGRYARGASHTRARLTPGEVTAMRNEHSNGVAFRALGRKYNVNYTTARQACLGKTWSHVS